MLSVYQNQQMFIEDADSPPEIWAHELFEEELNKIATIGALARQRGSRQFGVNLMKKGITPARLADSVFGRGNWVPYLPTRLVKGEKEAVNIAGGYTIE